jgi:putative flippase GtrA
VTRQIWVFAAVGSVSFLADIAAFNLLLTLSVTTLMSSFLSTSLATLLNFFGNLIFTFKDNSNRSLLGTAIKYLLVAAATIMLVQMLMAIGIFILDKPTLLEANIIKFASIAVVAVIRYVTFKHVVFK